MRAMHAACGGGGGLARHDAGQQHRSSMPVQLSVVQYYSTVRQYGCTRATVAAAPGRRVLLLLLRCASRPAARLGIRIYSRTALLKSHRRAFTTTH